MEKKDHVILALAALCILFAAVTLFDFGGSSDSQVPAQPQIQYKSSSTVPAPEVLAGFEEYFPENLELEGLQAFSTYPTAVGNELGPTADPYLSSLVASDALLFIEPGTSTNTFVDYQVYQFNDAVSAKALLNAYTSNWNNLKLSYSGQDIWVWEGYLEQSQSSYPISTPIYWDEFNKKAFLPTSSTGSVIVSQLGNDLYCRHGEMAVGNYFIMIDVHAPKNSVATVSQAIWEKALADLSDAPAAVSGEEVPFGIIPISVK